MREHATGGMVAKIAPRPGDNAVHEHWCSSGFANTDFDLRLMKRGLHKFTVIGLIGHTRVEATVLGKRSRW